MKRTNHFAGSFYRCSDGKGHYFLSQFKPPLCGKPVVSTGEKSTPNRHHKISDRVIAPACPECCEANTQRWLKVR